MFFSTAQNWEDGKIIGQIVPYWSLIIRFGHHVMREAPKKKAQVLGEMGQRHGKRPRVRREVFVVRIQQELPSRLSSGR